MQAGSRRRAITANSSGAASFPEQCGLDRTNFRHFLRVAEPVEATGVFYRGTALEDKVRPRFDVPWSATAETFHMVITSAHIPAIVALVAGILILVMPRLLNLVVAIYLICIGLIGLGVLNWLHLSH
jgi:hypothetical protein